MLAAILRSSLVIALALLLGRVLGFSRDAAIAAKFGIERNADIAVFLIGLPDFLINVLGAGGVTAILIVAFRQHPATASRLLFQSSLAILGGVGILALALMAVRGPLVDALAPGFDPIARGVAMDLLPLALLSAPVAAMTGATIAFLQAQNRFFIATIGTAIINLVLIVAILIPAEADTLLWLASAILAGALIRWLVQVLAIGRGGAGGFAFRPWLVDRTLLAHFARTAAAEAVVFFYPFALRAIATLFGIGALASVNFATKLVLLPLGVVIMTLTTVLLPRLAGLAPRAGQAGDIAGLRRMAEQGQFWTLVLSAMSAAVLIVHARWLVELAFGWGEIGDAGLRAISLYTAIYSISLLPMALNIFLRRVLNTMGDTSAPMIAEICGFTAFLGVGLAIVALNLPLEAVLFAAAGGGLVSTFVLLRARAGKEVRLGERLLRPGLWAAVVLSALATAAPGLILEQLAPGHARLPAIAIAAGGMAGLCAALAVNREARAAVRTLLPRRQ